MDARLIKQTTLFAFCLHPEKRQIFYVREQQLLTGRVGGGSSCTIIVHEDLTTNAIIQTFAVPREPRGGAGFILKYHRRKNYLILTFPVNELCVWDVGNVTGGGSQLLLLTQTGGKNPYQITSLALAEPNPQIIFFAALAQRNIYCCNLYDAVTAQQISSYTKLKFPKRVVVNHLACHPSDAKLLAACSDSQIRVWNYNGFTQLKSIFAEQTNSGNGAQSQQSSIEKHTQFLPSAIQAIFQSPQQEGFEKREIGFIAVTFSNDGLRVLAGTSEGKVYVYEGRNVGSRNTLLAQVRMSAESSGASIVSLAWFEYNGDHRSSDIVCYTSEGNVKFVRLFVPSNYSDSRASSNSDSKRSASTTNKNQQIGGDARTTAVQFGEVQELYDAKTEFMRANENSLICQAELLQTHAHGNFLFYVTVRGRGQVLQTNQPKSNSSDAAVIFQGRLLMLHEGSGCSRIEYPLLTQQYPHSIESLVPRLQKNLPGGAEIEGKTVILQRQLFYLDGSDIKAVSVARGTVHTLVSLKQQNILISEEIKLFAFSFRPLTLKQVDSGEFLLTYTLDNESRVVLVRCNVEDKNAASPTNQVQHFKEIPALQALFVGAPELEQAPIFYLHSNRHSYQLDISVPENSPFEDLQFLRGQVDSIRKDLSVKVQRVFWTPFQKGFVILYQNLNENVFHYSKNIDPKLNHILDYAIYQDGPSFRAAIDEIIVDVIWYWGETLPSGQQQQMHKVFGAIVTTRRIDFIDYELKKISSYQCCNVNATNLILQAQFFGATLVYATQTHVHYLTVDGATNILFSFDQFENKHSFGLFMLDRTLVVSRANSHGRRKVTDFKLKSFAALEPLALGYIGYTTLVLKTTVKRDFIAELTQILTTNHISSRLVKKLNNLGLYDISEFLTRNSEHK